MKHSFLKSVLDDWEPVNTESSRSVIFSISALRIKGGGLKIVKYVAWKRSLLPRSLTYFVMNCQKWILLTASQSSDTYKRRSFNDCKICSEILAMRALWNRKTKSEIGPVSHVTYGIFVFFNFKFAIETDYRWPVCQIANTFYHSNNLI